MLESEEISRDVQKYITNSRTKDRNFHKHNNTAINNKTILLKVYTYMIIQIIYLNMSINDFMYGKTVLC